MSSGRTSASSYTGITALSVTMVWLLCWGGAGRDPRLRWVRVGLGSTSAACQTVRMTQNLALLVSAADEPAKRHLPIPPVGFAIIALCVFLVLLVVTFAFRSSGTKH
jgi:hypothetical protein